jgi:hypothetical protein
MDRRDFFKKAVGGLTVTAFLPAALVQLGAEHKGGKETRDPIALIGIDKHSEFQPVYDLKEQDYHSWVFPEKVDEVRGFVLLDPKVPGKLLFRHDFEGGPHHILLNGDEIRVKLDLHLI